MLNVANITGTVTVAVGNGDQVEIATFEVPVTVTPDAAAGAVILRCPEPGCDATLAGRPGESIEHAEAGAHVYSPSLS